MICSMVLAPHTKKPPTPFEFFEMPRLKKIRDESSDSESSKQDNNLAQMFNNGMLNPLKGNNPKLYERLKSKGLIDEISVNKYILDKWQEK